MKMFRWLTQSEVVSLRLATFIPAGTTSRADIVRMVVAGAPALSADDRASVFAMLPAVKVSA